MRIGINLTGFGPGEMGGAETYIRNLIHHLQVIDTGNDYILICDKDHEKEFALFNASFRYAPANYACSSLKGLLRGVLRHRLKIDLRRSEIDGMNLTFVHQPFSDINPLGLKTPAVLTFLDMQQEFYPQFFSPAELAERKKSFRPSVSRAIRIMAISEHVKFCLVEKYNADPDKIDVIYLGCGPDFRLVADKGVLAEVALKYGLDAPFMIYPAATWPHKNHATLIHSLKILKETYGFDGKLVLTGISKQAHHDICRQVELLGLTDDIKILGYLPHGDLPYLYNLARLLVFPSLFEGFGMPVVEAMACGCPVVCSNLTSLPEITGSAGILFDPNCAEDMAEKLARVWTDDSLMQSMRVLGLERATLFTWHNTALKTIATYQNAYAS
jgi:glycosyltransferase involved in cell wall biosynthesis